MLKYIEAVIVNQVRRTGIDEIKNFGDPDIFNFAGLIYSLKRLSPCF